MSEISLDQFVFEQLQKLESFEKHWREQMKSDPQSFPDSAMRGDWDEQLDLWSRDGWNA